MLPEEARHFRGLLQEIREGSEDAAWELVENYGEPIRRAVRRALNSRLRSKFDSLDFVQIVWSSFFRDREQLDRFDRPEDLAAFLAKMARNKVGMEIRRRMQTEKYNLARERSLDDLPEQGGEEPSGDEPPPMGVAIAREQWDRMMANQPAHYRRIVQMRLEGHTYQEIADTLDLAESTVRRFVKRLFRETVA